MGVELRHRSFPWRYIFIYIYILVFFHIAVGRKKEFSANSIGFPEEGKDPHRQFLRIISPKNRSIYQHSRLEILTEEIPGNQRKRGAHDGR